jgi:hypothetical protein
MLNWKPLTTNLFVTVMRIEETQYEKIDTGPLLTNEARPVAGAGGR